MSSPRIPHGLPLFLVALAVLLPAFPLAAAPLESDVLRLAAVGPAVAMPTALAAADLDADGVPDLVVAYTAADETTLVVYPGDIEAVYPTGGVSRALRPTAFLAPHVFTTVPGQVAALTVVDADADGQKDLVATRTLDDALLLVGDGDGGMAEDEILDAETFDVLRARAEASTRRQRDVRASALPADESGAVYAATAAGDVAIYRPSAEAQRARSQPATPVALTPPPDALAVLPMRLNRDAIADLVVLRPGVSTPEVILSRAAATLVVTTTKDENGACDASCSLREAIIAANADPAPDVIGFAIPESDPGFQAVTGSWLIQPKGESYPVITEPVTIDGRTQPGFTDQPMIELSGGMFSDARVGLHLAASNSVIRGLIVSDWPEVLDNNTSACGCGIILDGADHCIIEGNFVGTDATGMQVKPNGLAGIGIVRGANNLVGGTTVEARNVISGNRKGFQFGFGVGTFIRSSNVNNTIAGNYIGVDKTGLTALPNANGVLLNSPNNTVGGTDPGAGNVIAGNARDMVHVNEASASAAGNEILGNYIGLTALGTGASNEGFGCGVRVIDADDAVIGSPGNGNLIAGTSCAISIGFSDVRSTSGHLIQANMIGVDALGQPLGNGTSVTLDNVFNARIGGTGLGEGNVVAHSTFGAGIAVRLHTTCSGCTSGTFRSNQNRILSNLIFDNSRRGIDLGNDGVTANDAGDGDDGANDLLNWPVLTGASSTGSDSTVDAEALTMGPASGQPYDLQFFANMACDSSGNGEGQIFLGEASRSADGSPVSVNLPVPIPDGYFVTATATDSLGNTSEFSNCVQASGGPVPVPSATPSPVPFEAVCDDCRDNDGDMLVDRDDPDCPPRSDGSGYGVPGKKRAKAVSKCQKTVAKTGQAYAMKLQKLLQKCLKQALVCVEQKAGDPGCLLKATKTCQKVLDTGDKLEAKTRAKITKACDEPRVLAADLVNAAGLGYLAERPLCQGSPAFVSSLDDAGDLGRCLTVLHECQAGQLVSQENPRARELLQLTDVNVFSFRCLLNPGASGGGQGVADAAQAKLLVKCATGIQKAAGKFGKARLGGLQKCLASVGKCLQEKPGDAKCLAGARKKCVKIAGKIGDAPKGAATKARAKIIKACSGADVELLAAVGLGQAETSDYCTAAGVPALTTASDVAECLIHHHTCRIDQLLDTGTPRARELLDIAGIDP